jgi:hypothetical protein
MARLTRIAVWSAVMGHAFAQEELTADETLTPPVIAETPGDVRLEAPPGPGGRPQWWSGNQTLAPGLGTSMREEGELAISAWSSRCCPTTTPRSRWR